MPSAWMPRIGTFEEPVPPARLSVVSTSSSALTSGRPSGPVAISGSARMMPAASTEMPLEISLSAPERITITFDSEPDSTSAARKPDASANAPTRIATTIAMPSAVVMVEAGRRTTLRMLYENGIAMVVS